MIKRADKYKSLNVWKISSTQNGVETDSNIRWGRAWRGLALLVSPALVFLWQVINSDQWQIKGIIISNNKKQTGTFILSNNNRQKASHSQSLQPGPKCTHYRVQETQRSRADFSFSFGKIFVAPTLNKQQFWCQNPLLSACSVSQSMFCHKGPSVSESKKPDCH